jgi:hypothetical protein
MIASRLFSKEFKRKIDFSFNGLCGVALTGNVSFDGIELPHWYCKKHSLKIGDTCLVLRDPVQNIFIALKIEGFTHNEIRVNSQTITVIDGDFDGDGLSVIPMSMLRAECEARGVKTEVIAQIESELNDLVPTKLLSNPDFSRLVRDYSL